MRFVSPSPTLPISLPNTLPACLPPCRSLVDDGLELLPTLRSLAALNLQECWQATDRGLARLSGDSGDGQAVEGQGRGLGVVGFGWDSMIGDGQALCASVVCFNPLHARLLHPGQLGQESLFTPEQP